VLPMCNAIVWVCKFMLFSLISNSVINHF
jgi:hypothetical protein